MRAALTVAVWIVSILSLSVAALIAAEFIFMATSLDPTDVIAAGTEPWTDALFACLSFLGLAVLTVLSLALWHSARFRPVGLILTVVQLACVVWASLKVYAEYF